MVELDNLWYWKMNLSENNCIQGVVFIETEHLLDKPRGNQMNWRPHDQAPDELAPTWPSHADARWIGAHHPKCTQAPEALMSPHEGKCRRHKHWRLLLFFLGCVNSPDASSPKHGYFAKKFKNLVIFVFFLKNMVILKKNPIWKLFALT